MNLMKTKTPSKSPKNSTPKRGNLSPQEIRPLVMAASKAFKIQEESGLTDSGEDFNTWRHRQCMEAIGKPGITACNHADFRPLLAHFQTLAGEDALAFKTHMRSGQPTDHATPGDTFEARESVVHSIAQALAAQAQLSVGYIVYLVRQKTRRPDLTLGNDWKIGLVQRCTISQLTQIHHTLVNRIAAVEGTGTSQGRNKSQRLKSSKAARSPATISERF